MTSTPLKGVREHFGRGRLAVEPAKAVFINCPYDAEFEPTFDAILFSVVCCGLIPRSALESGSVAVPRLERIVRVRRGELAVFAGRMALERDRESGAVLAAPRCATRTRRG